MSVLRHVQAIALLCLVSGTAPGQEDVEEFPSDHLSVFVGITDDGEDSDGSLGLDFEHRLGERFGWGGLVDYAGGDQRAWVTAVSLDIHPGGPWLLLLAPGVEYHDKSDQFNFLFRVGAMYEFEAGRYTISPALNLDLVDGEGILVYGVNIGRTW